MYRLEKSFTFEASHQLMEHDGKCARLHGHSWKGTMVIEANELVQEGAKRNMVMDYGDISAIIKPIVEDFLDHHHLNETLETTMPTSEFIARWVWEAVWEELPELAAVIIEETCTSRCEYRP